MRRATAGSRAFAGASTPGARLASHLTLGVALAACALLLAACSGAAGAGSGTATRIIVDMGGRKVRVPPSISKVFCSNPIGTADVYMLDPALLAGWNFKPSGAAARYLPGKYLALPSLGVWMGAGATPDIEEVLSVDPGVILCFWSVGAAGVQMADAIQKQSGLPVVLVDYDVRSTARTFAFLGALLGRQERGRVLAAYCRQKLAALRAVVAAVPKARRKSVFVAEGTGGLESDPVGSLHVQDTFDLLGLRNWSRCPAHRARAWACRPSRWSSSWPGSPMPSS